MKKLIATILILFNLQPAFAEVKYLEIGQLVPFTGYLFSPDLEKKFRLLDQDLDFCNKKLDIYSKLNENNNKIIDISNQRIDLYVTQNDKLVKNSLDQSKSEFWTNFLYFLLGVGTTTAVVFGVNKALK